MVTEIADKTARELVDCRGVTASQDHPGQHTDFKPGFRCFGLQVQHQIDVREGRYDRV